MATLVVVLALFALSALGLALIALGASPRHVAAAALYVIASAWLLELFLLLAAAVL